MLFPTGEEGQTMMILMNRTTMIMTMLIMMMIWILMTTVSTLMLSLTCPSPASLAAGAPLPYISSIPPLFRRGDKPLYVQPGER